jgi:hypothetical protein
VEGRDGENTNCEDTISLPIRFPMLRSDPLFSAISSCNDSTYCSDSNSWNRYYAKSSKTCFVLIVGLGNRYPRQLLNNAVHKVLVLFLGQKDSPSRGKSTWRNPRINYIENRTGGRKRRRNEHTSVWSDIVLSPVTTTISNSGKRYMGRHGLYSAFLKHRILGSSLPFSTKTWLI